MLTVGKDITKALRGPTVRTGAEREGGGAWLTQGHAQGVALGAGARGEGSKKAEGRFLLHEDPWAIGCGQDAGEPQGIRAEGSLARAGRGTEGLG